MQAVQTSVSIASFACAIIGMACPPAALPLACIGLALGTVGLANFIYSMCLPKGDILPAEKRMFYARIIKVVDLGLFRN